MKKNIIPIFALLCINFAANGQESPIHNQTTPPPNARFEIVQAQTAAKWTFRLDRFTGQVSQLVRTQSGSNAWQRTRIVNAPEITGIAHPHFQIFLSGLRATHSFLIDTDSGRAWTLTTLTDNTGKEVETVWDPFAE